MLGINALLYIFIQSNGAASPSQMLSEIVMVSSNINFTEYGCNTSITEWRAVLPNYEEKAMQQNVCNLPVFLLIQRLCIACPC
jgi:hypothetical protein